MAEAYLPHIYIRSIHTYTPRSFFSLLGYYRFAAAVAEFDRSKLGRALKIQSSLGRVTEWDFALPELEVGIQLVRRMIANLSIKWLHPRSHLSVSSLKTVYIAVDATPSRWAIKGLKASHSIIDFDNFRSRGDSSENEYDIAIAETLALESGIRVGKSQQAETMYMMSDNVAAGRAVDKKV